VLKEQDKGIVILHSLMFSTKCNKALSSTTAVVTQVTISLGEHFHLKVNSNLPFESV